MKRVLLAIAALSLAASAANAEYFQDRFGNWHWIGPDQRQGQQPTIIRPRDPYEEYRHYRNDSQIWDEYWRYRTCDWRRRRC